MMNLKPATFYTVLFYVSAMVHLVIWYFFVQNFQETFIRYYLFLSLLFIMVLTILSIAKRIYPDYLGFVFMGLTMFKLAMFFIIRNKLKIDEVPHYKLHFILPYLLALVLETFFAVSLLKDVSKDEKNQ